MIPRPLTRSTAGCHYIEWAQYGIILLYIERKTIILNWATYCNIVGNILVLPVYRTYNVTNVG